MNRFKKVAVVVFALPILSICLSASVIAGGEDAAATYKAKCTACHGAKADKAFDPAKADAALVDAVLKGVKPKMPAYDGKVSADDAKALVAYMKSLRK